MKEIIFRSLFRECVYLHAYILTAFLKVSPVDLALILKPSPENNINNK